jgi:hypothetical protein
MGRIAELLGEVAEIAEEGPDGLRLPPDAWDRLREDWNDEDIEDALGLVTDSLLLSELVESSDSLSARMVDFIGSYAASLDAVEAGAAVVSLEVLGQLARRVARLEDVLEAYRDGRSPDHTRFDVVQERLALHGLEDMFEIPGLPSERDFGEEDVAGRRARPRGAAPDDDDDEER